MRDYDNMPVLDWNDHNAPLKAKAQILHQEPVILQMQDDFDTSVDGAEFDCDPEESSGILCNCDGGKVLGQLAALNRLPSLNIIADACTRSSSQVDLDSTQRRLIIHD